jgi:hypothetical protein
MSLDGSARCAGAHVWAERRLFEVLGAWVADTPETEVRLMLDRHSHHAAWRADQWWDRLPVLADVDRDGLCRPGSAEVAAAADRLARLEGTAARLAGAYRFALPRMSAAYDRDGRRASPVADGSVLRTLGIVGPDLAADWREGEAALQAALAAAPDAAGSVRAAADAVAALELLLLV